MGKKNIIIFREDEIPSILNIYSLRTKHKEYKRIPYEIWKQLKHASKWKVEYSYEIPKWFEIIVDDRWSYFYNNEEIAGFCDFLLDYLEEKEQAESIMPVDHEKIKLNYEEFCSSLDSCSNTIGELVSHVSAIDKAAVDGLYNSTITALEANYYNYSDSTSAIDKVAVDGFYNSTITTPQTNYYDNKINSTLATTSSNWITITDSIEEKAKEVYKEMKENENIFKEEKGDKNMKGFNFEFGTCEKDNVRMSMYGLAVQNATGSWVSYNATNKSVIDVDILNVDCRKYMFKMPVAIKDIKVGDVVIHNKKPMFVVDKTNGLTVIDVVAGEEKKILLTKNMFGFDFATKVVSMFDMSGANATADSPFGNMLPLLLLGNETKGDNDAMLMYMMMQGQSGFDPMMMMLLMGDNKSSNMLPLMFMMNQNKPKAVENKE